MVVRLSFEWSWNGGKIHVETASVSELTKTVEELRRNVPQAVELEPRGISSSSSRSDEFPHVRGDIGCAQAIRALLSSDWGHVEARTESELTNAMKANAIHYPHGTISGLLTSMTKRGNLRRAGKKNGSYAYVIASSPGPASTE